MESSKTGEIVLYQPEGEVKLEVRVENETVWLTQAQMGILFERERSVIAKHIGNVFKEGYVHPKCCCILSPRFGSHVKPEIHFLSLSSIICAISSFISERSRSLSLSS